MIIKNRYTSEVIIEIDDSGDINLRNANLREANLSGANLSEADLSGADLRGADLRWAILSEADLSGADLRGADLRWAILSEADLSGAYINFCLGNFDTIRTMQLEYSVVICDDLICIGCETHRAHEWMDFDDKQIIEMDGKKALKWWKKNKALVFSFLDAD